MSQIKFTCPECGGRISAEPEAAHSDVTCPHCSKHIRMVPLDTPPPLSVPAEPVAPFSVPEVKDADGPLTLENLTTPKESTYLKIVIIVSILGWLLAAIFVIFYGPFIALFVWLGHGLLIGYLKSEGVRVTEEQLPKLHRTFESVCVQLDVAQMPALYVIQQGGLLNAFATRFLQRNFVVVFSDMLEACGEDSARMRFILGHELGHIKRGHILKLLLLLPGRILPLLGPAYSRACEATCDRHGAFACNDFNGGIQAMMNLSGGKVAGNLMNAEAFAKQHQAARGFFVSWHELTSGYPTLCQRVYNLVSLRDGVTPRSSARHPLAYLFALLSPGGRTGGSSSVLVTIAVFAVLLALAMPAFSRAKSNANKVHQANQQRLEELQRSFETPGSPPK